MKYGYHIRLPGEFGTKRKHYRKRLITLLSQNIQKALLVRKNKNPRLQFDLLTHFDHLELYATEPLHDFLVHIPGIYGFYPIIVKSYQSLEEIYAYAEAHFKEKVKGKTFAVRVKARDVSLSARRLEREIGALLYSYAKGVDLTNPEITCSILIYPHQVSFYSEEVIGMGGFPGGTQRKVLLLFSGGIDSPIAAWHLYRMGFEIDYLFYDLGSKTVLQCAYNLALLLHQRHNLGRKSRFFYIPFDTIVMTIQEKVAPPFQNLALKWAFYQVANQIAAQHKLPILATGESLGQVSTQTLESLLTLSTFSSLPILRPLLFQTKTDILKQAHALDTYQYSYKGKEYCALTTRNVRTKPTPESLQEAVRSIDPNLFQTINSQILYLHREDPLPSKLLPTTPSDTQIDHIIAIDLTPNDLPKQFHSKSSFYSFSEAWNECLHLDPNRSYLLICPTGQRAKLIANLLKENGFTNLSTASIHEFIQDYL